MIDNVESFGRQLFQAIFLVVVAVISAQISFGYDSRRAKEMFIILFLLLIIGTQYFYLFQAVSYIPASEYFTYNVRH